MSLEEEILENRKKKIKIISGNPDHKKELKKKYYENLTKMITDAEKLPTAEERDKALNRIPRRKRNLLTIQKIIGFYLQRGVKKGSLVTKEDCHKDKDTTKSIIDKMKNNLSPTQIGNMLGKTEEEIRSILERRFNASLYEQIYDETYKLDISLQVLKEELLKNLELSFDNYNTVKYRSKIVGILETTEDIIRRYLDEIKTDNEFQITIMTLIICNDIAELPKRDRRKIYEEKRSFNNKKKKVISFLKEHNLQCTDVEKTKFKSPDENGWTYYENTLRKYKNILSNYLIDSCNTGKNRAKEIAKLLDYL